MGYYPNKVAGEIVDIFAKYQVPIAAKEVIYGIANDLIELQAVTPISKETRWMCCMNKFDREKHPELNPPKKDENIILSEEG